MGKNFSSCLSGVSLHRFWPILSLITPLSFHSVPARRICLCLCNSLLCNQDCYLIPLCMSYFLVQFALPCLEVRRWVSNFSWFWAWASGHEVKLRTGYGAGGKQSFLFHIRTARGDFCIHDYAGMEQERKSLHSAQSVHRRTAAAELNILRFTFKWKI